MPRSIGKARKMVALAAGALTLVALAPQGHATEPQATPSAFGGVFQTADGIWIRKEAGGTYMYFAGGSHFTNLSNQKAQTRAWADKTKCAVAKTKDIKVIACGGRVRAERIDAEDFVFDPLLEEATLAYEKNRVAWLGQDLPEPWAFPFADPEFGAIAFAEVDRWALASGRVLGQEFSGKNQRWMDFGYLSEGAFAGVFLDARGARIWMDSNDRVNYRFRFEIPS